MSGRLRGTRRNTRAGAGVVAALVLLGGCAADPGGQEERGATTAVSQEPATTVPPEPSTAPPPPLPAPWSHEPLPATAVPSVLLTEWRKAGNRRDCRALAPDDLGEGEGATPRRAAFGPDAWAVAWDLPGAPGVRPSGEFCPSCGRGTFLVAGTTLDVDTGRGRPAHDVLRHERRWADASTVRYGPEGGDGPAWLAQLEVAGQRCLYNVRSFLGRGHLEHLLDHLRFVAAESG